MFAIGFLRKKEFVATGLDSVLKWSVPHSMYSCLRINISVQGEVQGTVEGLDFSVIFIMENGHPPGQGINSLLFIFNECKYII